MSAENGKVEYAVMCGDGSLHWQEDYLGDLKHAASCVGTAEDQSRLNPPPCGPHRLVQRLVTSWHPVPVVAAVGLPEEGL